MKDFQSTKEPPALQREHAYLESMILDPTFKHDPVIGSDASTLLNPDQILIRKTAIFHEVTAKGKSYGFFYKTVKAFSIWLAYDFYSSLVQLDPVTQPGQKYFYMPSSKTDQPFFSDIGTMAGSMMIERPSLFPMGSKIDPAEYLAK